MSPSGVYRVKAEDCLRMAKAAQHDNDRPFWLGLAMSWLTLAEHSAQRSSGVDVEPMRVTADRDCSP